MNNVIFLTGATGLVGSNLIPRVLRNDNTSQLVLLVRGRGERDARRRLTDLLAHVSPELVSDDVKRRITVLEGDITAERLGLPDSLYTDLSSSVTHIIHSAASVQFQLPLEEARRINVSGTSKVMQLAQHAMSAGKLQRVAYVSTAYVSGKRSGDVFEDELDCGQDFANTYERSKFESERHVRSLMKELPITVFRPSIIVGDSLSGRTLTFNVLYFPLKLIHRGLLRILPGSHHTPTDVVPVDYVCDALCHIFLNTNKGIGKTYHLTAGSSRATTAGEVVDLAVEFFNETSATRRLREVRFVPRHLYRAVARLMNGWAKKALELMSIYESYLCVQRIYSDLNTRDALRDSHIAPPLFKTYYHSILQYCVDSDWGRRPRLAA